MTMNRITQPLSRPVRWLIPVGYFTAVLYASLTLCNHTIWAAKPWQPENLSTERWQGPIAEIAFQDDEITCYARTVIGPVKSYRIGEKHPTNYLSSRQYLTIQELIQDLLQAQSDDDWNLFRITTIWNRCSLVADRNDEYMVLASPDLSETNRNPAMIARVYLVSRQTGKIVKSLYWLPGTIDLQNLVLLPNNKGLLIHYDSCIEHVQWDDAFHVSRTKVPVKQAKLMAYDEQSHSIYIAHERDEISRYDLKNHLLMWTNELETRLWISALTYDASQHKVLFGLPEGSIYMANDETGEFEDIILFRPEGISSLKMNPNAELFVGFYDGRIEQWDYLNHEQIMAYSVAGEQEKPSNGW